MDAYLLARFLHILFAAIWLSQNVTSGRLAKALARGGQDALSSRSVKSLSVMGALSGVMTLSTGMWLVSLTGDWETAPIAIHIGATLAIVLFLIGAWPVSRGWRKLLKASEQMEDGNLRSVQARNITRWSHISMGIWGVILAAMVFRHL